MGGRAFDPALFDFVDNCTLGEESEAVDYVIVESCPLCGTQDLVMVEDRLVTLDGEAHVCPEADGPLP